MITAKPAGNVKPEVAQTFLTEVLNNESMWRPVLDAEAHRRADALVASHARVREADDRRGVSRGARYRAQPQLPVDVLGLYLYLPVVV